MPRRPPLNPRPLFTSKRSRLLNAAQRKSLHKRIYNHAHSIEWEYHEAVRKEKDPPAVAKARKIVDDWEESQDKRRKEFDKRIEQDTRDLYQNLLFDSAEDCLLQVRDFEETTVETYKR